MRTELRLWWNQLWCGLWRRHDDLLVLGVDRLYLRCQNCHRETVGWSIASL